jgi:type IV secretion system protein TrbL
VIVAGDIFGDIFSTIGNVLGGAASAAAAGVITVFAHAVLGSLTRAIEWLSTVWMNTPTPTLVDASGTATGTVGWMQAELLPLTAALAVGSVIVGGAKIAIAEAGHTEAREFARWLFVYALASAGGVAVAAMLIATCDGFANYIIAQASAGSNFGDHLAQGLGLLTRAVGSGTLQPQGGFLLGLAGTGASAMLAIIIGLIALVASFVEFVLMAFRGGVLVILCGLIPLAAAFSNVPTGERWLRRIAGWIVALAMYKLAAAFCYAAAFRLSDGTDAIAVMDGLGLLVVSVLALPVLLRLTLPAAEHFTLHRGAAATTRTAIGAIPTGAISLAAAGGGSAAMMATGAVGQAFASGAGGGGGASGGPSGARAGAGGGGGPAGASGKGGGRATGSAPGTIASAAGMSGAGGTSGSGGGAGNGSSGPADPTAGEGSGGGGVTGATSTSFGRPGTGGSPGGDGSSGDGGSAMPSGTPGAGAPPGGVNADGSHANFEVPSEEPAGGSGAVGRSQNGPFAPDDPGSAENPSGPDESWSGD